MSLVESADSGPSDDSLKRLRAIRRGNRSTVTKLEKCALELLQNSGQETSAEKENTAMKLATIAKTLKTKLDYLAKLGEEVMEKCQIEETEKEVDEATEISARIIETIDRIDMFGRKVDGGGERMEYPPTSTPTRSSILMDELQSAPQPTNVLNQSGSSISSSRVNQGIRLPKISLQRFRGDVTKFQTFWQGFKCAIADNDSLTDVYKLTYLVNSLEGPAYRALEGLEITEENYGKAVEILKTRFGKSQQIISAHMQKLLNLQTHPNDNIMHLRAIFDITVHVRGLKSLGISAEKYGSLLIPVIMSIMPSDISLQVARKTSEDITSPKSWR